MAGEAILPEAEFREWLGLTPIQPRVPAGLLIGMDLGICLNIKDGGPVGKWIKVRSVERILRTEAEHLDLPILEVIADQLCDWADLSPARTIDAVTGG